MFDLIEDIYKVRTNIRVKLLRMQVEVLKFKFLAIVKNKPNQNIPK